MPMWRRATSRGAGASARAPEHAGHAGAAKVQGPTGAVHQHLHHVGIGPVVVGSEGMRAGGDARGGVVPQGGDQRVGVGGVEQRLVALEVDDDVRRRAARPPARRGRCRWRSRRSSRRRCRPRRRRRGCARRRSRPPPRRRCCMRAARSAVRTTRGRPPRSSSSLPGKRLEPQRAGITTRTRSFTTSPQRETHPAAGWVPSGLAAETRTTRAAH